MELLNQSADIGIVELDDTARENMTPLPTSMSTFLQDSMLKKDLKHSLVKLGMLLVHMT